MTLPNPRVEHLQNPPEASYRLNIWSHKVLRFGWHSHPEYEIACVEKGGGQRFVGDHVGYFPHGDLICTGPHLPHTFFDQTNTHLRRVAVAQFRADLLGPNWLEMPEFRRIGALLRTARRGLIFPPDLQPRVWRHMEHMHQLAPTLRLTHLLELLHMLAEAPSPTALATPAYVEELSGRNDPRIAKALNYIHQHLAAPVRLDEVAGQVHLSGPALSRLFGRIMGRSLPGYVNQLRIGRACRLLTQTDDSILAIAQNVGYDNLANFNRQFLRYQGCTPRQYRHSYNHALAPTAA